MLGDLMKQVDFNYSLSLRNYDDWVSQKPEGYDEIMLKYSVKQEVKPVPAPAPPAPEPEKKKKRKGKKKKCGRRR